MDGSTRTRFIRYQPEQGAAVHGVSAASRIMYNLTGEPAPFDADSPYWIVPNALAAARHLGIDEREIVTVVAP